MPQKRSLAFLTSPLLLPQSDLFRVFFASCIGLARGAD